MYVGKQLIAGITLVNSNGEVEEKQILGVITACSQDVGIVMGDEAGHEVMRLPYWTRSLVAAPKGSYRLSSSGINVANPDFLTSWIFRQDTSGVWHAEVDAAIKTHWEHSA